jgi:hypothetical protein
LSFSARERQSLLLEHEVTFIGPYDNPLNMLAKPNKTVIEGTIRAIVPSGEGHGHQIEIEVHRNLSGGRSDDFIQPAEGQSLILFVAQTPDVTIGDRVRVQARLMAGPFGERTVLEQLEPLSDQA